MTSSLGEDFLKEHGLVQRSSKQRQQLLGCLGCRWNKEPTDNVTPRAYGYQIIKCTGIKSGVVFPLLQSLENAGVVESSWEDIDPGTEGRPPRRLFKPSESQLGQKFAATLTPPSECQLKNLISAQDS